MKKREKFTGMNKQMINSLIRDLNSISRMAILENAMVTEQLLCSYTRIIKYQLSHERKSVMMKSELNCIKELCNFYKLKMNHTLSCLMSVDEGIEQAVVPHFSYAKIVYDLLEQIGASEAKEFILNIAFQVQGANMVCRTMLSSSQPMEDFVQQLADGGREYETSWMGVGVDRLKEYFGERMLCICNIANTKMEITIEIKDEMGETSGIKK